MRLWSMEANCFAGKFKTPEKIGLKPFNDHRSQLIGSSLFCYNSLAAAAREVFKPSPDSASLVVSSQKKKFSVLV